MNTTIKRRMEGIQLMRFLIFFAFIEDSCRIFQKYKYDLYFEGY
jgi:hypothetical protein